MKAFLGLIVTHCVHSNLYEKNPRNIVIRGGQTDIKLPSGKADKTNTEYNGRFNLINHLIN